MDWNEIKNNKVDKPWGYEIHWAKTGKYVGKLLFIKAGQRLSKQYHEVKEETVFVLKGPLLNYDENDEDMMEAGEDYSDLLEAPFELLVLE